MRAAQHGYRASGASWEEVGWRWWGFKERQDGARSQETQGWAPGCEASSAQEASLGPGHRPRSFTRVEQSREGTDKTSGLVRLPGAELDQVEAPHPGAQVRGKLLTRVETTRLEIPLSFL